ncbi:GlcG/HbpS family heme-binding protein [Pseudactinotalea sp. Z1739]|uniref:GlcG/HbpS family heme-binding protein n=1 Tax=Pseudactinotalea sp. Z1739 TaxID=3413028 RepID=UPI003C7E110C
MEKTTTTVVAVSLESALRIVRLGIEEGAKRGLLVCIAVVDPGLRMVAMGRADGTTPHSLETSRRKAVTAATTRRASGWMEGDFALALPMASGGELTNILGGFPVVVDGAIVGGFGVAGATPAEDAEIGDVVSARLEESSV